MAASATGGVSQPRFVERGDFDDLGQFDTLQHKLRDAVAALDHDGFAHVEVDQETLISPRYPASIVPGLLTIERPTRAAKPERG